MRLGIKSDGTGDGTTFYDLDTGNQVIISGCTSIEWRVNAQTNVSECGMFFVNIPVELTLPPLMETRVLNIDKEYVNRVVDLKEEIGKFNGGQPLENVTEGQRTADQIAKAFGVEADEPGLGWQSAKKMREKEKAISDGIAAKYKAFGWDATDGAHS